ncbi:YqaJ domain-containing protein [Aphis craccivora]|uniref:YqaJ domain-containing protein n=1 Tax=Aphis craccivora TaxID=307492 RepID=A0A6G0YEE9_APHCR|nr:YqaJ domain-containing protein [Aphis craccivora]
MVQDICMTAELIGITSTKVVQYTLNGDYDHILQKRFRNVVLNSDVKTYEHFSLALNQIKIEPKKIQMNMSINYSQDIRTRDVTKIDTAVDAASFLVGIVQTYLGKNKQPKLESPELIIFVYIKIKKLPYSYTYLSKYRVRVASSIVSFVIL